MPATSVYPPFVRSSWTLPVLVVVYACGGKVEPDPPNPTPSAVAPGAKDATGLQIGGLTGTPLGPPPVPGMPGAPGGFGTGAPGGPGRPNPIDLPDPDANPPPSGTDASNPTSKPKTSKPLAPPSTPPGEDPLNTRR